MPGTVRRMIVKDAEAVTRLHIDSWLATYRGILPDEMLDGLDYERRLASRREQVGDPQNQVANWVLEHEGCIRGWIAVGAPRDDDVTAGASELYAIYLVPNDRGKGYGRTLMTHALAQARAAGAPEMVLWVLADNPASRRFYSAAGFRPDERRAAEPFLQTGADKVRLCQSL